MYDKDHGKDKDPTDKGAHSSSVSFLVEDDVSNKEGTKDLRHPIYEIVQSPSTDGEDGSIVIVEFCIIPTKEIKLRINVMIIAKPWQK